VYICADVVKNKVVREIATVGIGALAAGVTVTALVLHLRNLQLRRDCGFYAVATDSSSCFKGNRAACVGGALGGLSELGGLFPNNAFVGGFSANVELGNVTISHFCLLDGRIEDEKVAAALMERFGYGQRICSVMRSDLGMLLSRVTPFQLECAKFD